MRVVSSKRDNRLDNPMLIHSAFLALMASNWGEYIEDLSVEIAKVVKRALKILELSRDV